MYANEHILIFVYECLNTCVFRFMFYLQVFICVGRDMCL